MSAEDDQELLKFALDLIERIRTGEKIFIHCWAGRGRTGIVVAILLGIHPYLQMHDHLIACIIGILYGLPPNQALERTNTYFQQREIWYGDSPEYINQKKQVIRVIKLHNKQEILDIEKDDSNI